MDRTSKLLRRKNSSLAAQSPLKHVPSRQLTSRQACSSHEPSFVTAGTIQPSFVSAGPVQLRTSRAPPQHPRFQSTPRHPRFQSAPWRLRFQSAPPASALPEWLLESACAVVPWLDWVPAVAERLGGKHIVEGWAIHGPGHPCSW